MKKHILLLLTVGVVLAADDPKTPAEKEARTHDWEAVGYIIKGDYDKGIAECTEAIRFDPKYDLPYLNRGGAYLLKGEHDKAIADFDQAIRLNPKNAAPYSNRAVAYAAKGSYREAIKGFQQAIKVEPNRGDTYGQLADLLATCPKAELRDGKKAVELATKACELTKWNDTISLSALAAAYAEIGDFTRAVEWQKKAIEANGSLVIKRKQDVEEDRQRLKRYEEGKPYRRHVTAGFKKEPNSSPKGTKDRKRLQGVVSSPPQAEEPGPLALRAAGNQTAMTHAGIVRGVAFSPDGKTLASAGDDRAIKLWDTATGKETATFKGHTDGVLSLAYSPDGKTLASVSKDTIKLWDTATGKEQATLKGHAEGCFVAFSPDGKTLAEGSKERTIKLWDVQAREVRAALKWRKDWLAEQVAPLPKEEAAVVYSPDGKTLASGNVDKTIHLWDVKTGKERLALTGHVGRLTCLAYSPDGKTLASAGGPINLWDVKTGQQTAVLFGQPLSLTSLAFSPDGKMLASSGEGKTITLWDVRTGKERATLAEQTDWVTSVAFSPDGKLLASSSRRYLAANRWLGTVRLWDVPTSK